jgi:hypothetical protein
MLGSRPWGYVGVVVLFAAACGGGTASTTTAGTGAGTQAGGSGGSPSTSAGPGVTSSSGMGSITGPSGSTTSTGTGTPGACAVFKPDSPWNTDISDTTKYPNDPLSSSYIKSIGLGGHLHPDFGTDPTYGIPYQYVNSSVAKSTVVFDPEASDESDPGPYPIPADPLIEGAGESGDQHLLMIHTDECVLYELDVADHQADGWHAYSGAIWDLKINSTRPQGWTSADAAGLPIYPGLARYEEVAQGAINHALRFTVSQSQKAYVAPAEHCASSSTDTTRPPMGLRLRLNASFDLGAAPPQSKIILTALKKYGMIVADNGASWFVSGAPDPGWDDNDLEYIKSIPGNAFEAITTGPLTTDCP